MLPLYKALQSKNEKPELKKNGNAGLWFERFFDAYPEFGKTKAELSDNEKESLVDAENEWLDKFCGTVGDAVQLERKALQQLALIQSLKGGAHVYETQWHFVTGMGIPHPIENGLIWHPTLGVPYLPGAAVKGIVRAWLETWGGDADTQKQKACLLALFGSDDKDSRNQQVDNQAGGLIFFDALPVSSVRLGIDVMTPHMGDWYAQGNTIKDLQKESKKIPADWHDPVPVKYLVVKEAKFLFSVAPRHKEYIGEVCDVMSALKDALDLLGAGAKTAVGYGQLAQDDEETNRLHTQLREIHHQKLQMQQESRIKETLSELAFKFYKQSRQAGWESNKDSFCRDFNGPVGKDWLETLRQSCDPDLHEQIATLVNLHFARIMNDPDRTQGRRAKPVYKDWIREVAKQLIAFSSNKKI